MFKKVQDWLKGKKTYLVALAGIVAAVLGYTNGDLTVVEAIGTILAALGVGTFAAKVNRLEPAKKK